MKRKPDFLIIGAQKSGTTWLLEVLKKHSDVFMAPAEIHFFNNKENYKKGFDWYSEFYKDAASDKLVGEKTPVYFSISKDSDEQISKTLAKDLPAVKMIVMLREPVARSISALKHHIRKGRINPNYSLDYIIKEKPEILDKYDILNFSKYDEILEEYYKHFPSIQLKVLFYEDIKRNPENLIREVCEFLNLNYSDSLQENRRINAFEKSKLYLFTNYYFPKLNGLVNKVDRFLPKAKLETSSESKAILEKALRPTKDYFNRNFRTPSVWK